jgi:dienelactone hydrolase
MNQDRDLENRFVHVQTEGVTLEGNLAIPPGSEGIVIFVHGSGSSRHSPRNQYVARELQEGGLGTLLFDLLTAEEEQIDLRTRHLRFDIDLLARRTIGTADWLSQQHFAQGLKLGFFGSSTGAAAALIAAAERPELTGAVVSRGGRPDLAGSALPHVHVPILLIVGGMDRQVIEMNKDALAKMPDDSEKEITIVPGATHLFEEPGTLEQVARLARDWFKRYLTSNEKD